MTKKWRYIPALLCMGAIFFTSSRSGDQLNSVLPWFQQMLPSLSDFDPMHYVAYFALALTLAYGMGRMAFTWKGCLLNVAICLAYGVTDEWHQSFVPMRSPDPLDLLHDGMGAAAAALLVLLIAPLFNRRGSRNYTAR
ncbi:VanZ family protein [Cohnella terricola]|uniref:VanZ-like domain-containing protein n=1 Tax=Cohnella terricola TaxID=1289167 RepID=A0A559JL95_9BACL|nr:VanZ family protein [Cohnella terricola]TVY00653.1 hypothetical protein FPZ45_11635 [Cohnella terricola]